MADEFLNSSTDTFRNTPDDVWISSSPSVSINLSEPVSLTINTGAATPVSRRSQLDSRLGVSLEINEGTTPVITVEANDSSGAAIDSSSIAHVFVRVDDYHGRENLLAESDIGPANPATFVLGSDLVTIIDDAHDYEYRFVTFDFVYDTDKHRTEQYVVKIKNLRFF